MFDVSCSPADPSRWHRMEKTDRERGQCSVCGCHVGQLTKWSQLHKRSDGEGTPRYYKRDSATNIVPRKAVCERMRKAATAVAAGANLLQAAQAAGVSNNTLKSHRLRYPETWQAFCDEARKQKGSLTADDVIHFVDEDPGLTDQARRGIERATAMIATGATREQVRQTMRLAETTVENWQESYPVYWKRCYRQSIVAAREVIATLFRTGKRPTDVAAYLKQLDANDHWSNDSRLGKSEMPPPDANAELSPDMSLSKFFWSYFRPACLEAVGARDATLIEYEHAVRLWARYTRDPALSAINQKLAASFVLDLGKRISLKTKTAISPNTIRKTCIAIQAILDRAGPRTRKNRMGTNLINDVIWITRPKARPKPAYDVFTLEEIGRWLAACDTATRPNLPGVSPATWWRSLIIIGYNTGLRLQTLLGLKWSMVNGEWLDIPPEIIKGQVFKRLYLNPQARAALDALGGRGDNIFPWPHGVRHLHRCRGKMLKAAGFPKARRFGFHGLRKALATQLSTLNAAAATIQLGHTTARMTTDHYINPESVATALNQLPQPIVPKLLTHEPDDVRRAS